MDDDDKFRMKKKAAGALLKVKVLAFSSLTFLSIVTVDNATIGNLQQSVQPKTLKGQIFKDI